MKEAKHPSDALLLGWFDAELEGPERAAVDAHLAGCADCRGRARRIEEVSGAVAACRELVFKAAVAAPVRRMPWRWGAYALAGLAAAGLAAVVLMPDRHKAPKPKPAAVANVQGHVDYSGKEASPAATISGSVGQHGIRPRKADCQSAAGCLTANLPHKDIEERQRPVEFLPLPFSDETLPISQAAVVRVELPRSAMRLVGVPVEPDRWGDRVQADVVLGMDGLARAIRFIE